MDGRGVLGAFVIIRPILQCRDLWVAGGGEIILIYKNDKIESIIFKIVNN